jgi:hypothetical protein
MNRGGRISAVLTAAPALAAALALAAGTTGSVTARAAADPVPSPSRSHMPAAAPHTFQVPDEVKAAVIAASASTLTGCGPPASTPVPDGQPIVVKLPPAAAFTVGKISASMWRHPSVSDPAWQLSFYGFMWLHPLAQRAAQDGQQKSLAALIDQAVQFHRLDPDPGEPRLGWDEGASMRRLTAENCLYQLTHSTRLISGMIADAKVLLGPRYYGPPYHQVHNHGVMANLAVLHASALLGNRQWRLKATARLRAESTLAFSRKGVSLEQSSSYQALNIRLWARAAEALEEAAPADPAVRTLRQVLAKADRVLAWLTEPDRNLVMIGESDETAGTTRSKAQDRVFRDDQAGLGIGRWSWSAPGTTYYTVRYGPPMRAHGQQDRGGVTWSALGARILVGPGRYSYDHASTYYPYAKGPASHNVAFPTRRTLVNSRTVSVRKMSYSSTSQAWQLADSLYGTAHARALLVNAKAHRLTATDTFAHRASFVQKWHLDSAWRLASVTDHGRRAVFTRSGGRRLVLTTTGSVSVRRGSTRPVAGWYFPSLGRRRANTEVTVSAHGTATTTFTIS